MITAWEPATTAVSGENVTDRTRVRGFGRLVAVGTVMPFAGRSQQGKQAANLPLGLAGRFLYKGTTNRICRLYEREIRLIDYGIIYA